MNNQQPRQRDSRFWITVLSVLATTATWVCLLYHGKLSEVSLCALFILTLGGFPLIYNVDRLSKMVAETKWGKLLFETYQFKQEVEVKAESVRKMGEELADFNARTVAAISRRRDVRDEGIFEIRDRLREMLVEIGSSDTRISEICGIIEQPYIQRLVDRASHAIARRMAETNDNQPHPQANEYVQKYRRILLESPAGKASGQVRPDLEAEGFWSDDVAQALSFLDDFRLSRKATPALLEHLRT